MSATQPTPLLDRPRFLRPPGYFATKRVIAALKKFQNLIRHRERWAYDLPFACPIEELIPSSIPAQQQGDYLDQEITKEMQLIQWNINAAGVQTAVIYNRRNTINDQIRNDHYDLILDYFRLPRAEDSHKAYAAVMQALSQAIGVYEARLRQAKRELYNPVIWIANLVHIPVMILERAGIVEPRGYNFAEQVGWSRGDKLSAATLLVGALALIAVFTVPEVRRWVGLDKPAPVPIAAVETKAPGSPLAPVGTNPRKTPDVHQQLTSGALAQGWTLHKRKNNNLSIYFIVDTAQLNGAMVAALDKSDIPLDSSLFQHATALWTAVETLVPAVEPARTEYGEIKDQEFVEHLVHDRIRNPDAVTRNYEIIHGGSAITPPPSAKPVDIPISSLGKASQETIREFDNFAVEQVSRRYVNALVKISK